MPVDYKCNHCMLRFSVGPYHYHRLDSGYSGRILLVCRCCGTQHAAEAALKDRGPEIYEYIDLVVESIPVRARAKVLEQVRRKNTTLTLIEAFAIIKNTPFILFNNTEKSQIEEVCFDLEKNGVIFRISIVEQRANPIFGPLMQDRLLYAPRPRHCTNKEEMLVSNDAIKSDGIWDIGQSWMCQYCKSIGTLIYEFEEDDSLCPSCKNNELIIERGWIT